MTTAAKTATLREAPVLDIDPDAIEVLHEPYAFHEALREAGPIAFIKPHGVYAVGRHSEAKTVLTDPARFSNAAASASRTSASQATSASRAGCSNRTRRTTRRSAPSSRVCSRRW